MPFRSRSRGLGLRPVNRIKHVIDIQFATTAGTEVDHPVITASDTPDLANVDEVQTGATVHAVYAKVEANLLTTSALPNFYFIVYKNPGGNIVGPTPNAVGASDNKRFVIHQEMVMMQEQAKSNPRTIFNGVISIPRGYRRFGPNDTLNFRFLAPGFAPQVCFQVHYKEFR